MTKLFYLITMYAAVVTGLTLSGCKVGPDYHSPHETMPAAFGAAAQSPAVDPNHMPLAKWWTCFDDAKLNSLVARALAANHELKIAQAHVLEARAFERIAKSALYPTIDLDAMVAKTRGSAAGYAFPYGLPGVSSDLYQVGFDATYEVDLFGGTRRKIEAAVAIAEAVEYERDSVQVTVLGEVARNYISLRSLQRRLAVARANLDDQQQTLEIVKKRNTNGLASDFDVIRAQSQVTATKASIPPLEAGINQTIYGLSILLGVQPMKLVPELTTEAPIPPAPSTIPVGMPSELLRRRPDIRRAERLLASATAEQGVAVADLFPHLVLSATAGVQSQEADTLFNQHDPTSGFYLAGPVASWNVFDGGRRLANIDRTKAHVAAAASAYEATVLQSLRDVESSLTAYSHDQIRRSTLQNLCDENQKAVRIAKNKYANGILNLLDVLEVQHNLYAAQDSLAQADQAVSSDLVSLYKALGGGWELVNDVPAVMPASVTGQKQSAGAR